MKKVLSLITLFISLAFAQEGQKAVVFDLTLDNLESFKKKVLSGTVKNITHYQDALEELSVTYVIHGGAYKFFIKDLLATIYKDEKELIGEQKEIFARLKSLAETYEVEFLMCESGMKKNGIDEKNIYKFVKIVPTSTIGLIDKQSEGYVYLPISK